MRSRIISAGDLVEKDHGSDEPFSTSVKSLENEGRYFHPLLGTLITGAARLMIAIAERLAADEGISWAFCDTDSLALAQLEGMPDEEFLLKAQRIRKWFTALSPYEGKPDLFKMEDENFRIAADKSPKQLEPLFCWAVSAKRHALFNLDTDGRPVIRKASRHGLGHLQDPYSETDAPVSIPAPRVPLAVLKVHRWQHDFWFRIIEAGLSENPDRLKLEDIPGFDRPAASRYAATTPAAARWFERYNQDKPYREQVRPFGFLLAFPARKAPFQFDGRIPSGKGAEIRPVGPYGPVETAALSAFDRETGERVPPKLLLTYSQVLSRYHIHPEDKFENADYDDRGTTVRRHIRVHGIEHIGKESNRWEDRWHLGSDADSKVSFGSSPENLKRTRRAIQSAVRLFGVRRVAGKAGMSPAGISGFTRGKSNLSPAALVRIRSALVSLKEEADRSAVNLADLEKKLAAAIEKRISIRHLARVEGFDPANLRKAIRGLRPFSQEMRARLEKVLADLKLT
jgi:transcriptional regulator with XRE-family HTH domain